jgi:hypothetical protein
MLFVLLPEAVAVNELLGSLCVMDVESVVVAD